MAQFKFFAQWKKVGSIIVDFFVFSNASALRTCQAKRIASCKPSPSKKLDVVFSWPCSMSGRFYHLNFCTCFLFMFIRIDARPRCSRARKSAGDHAAAHFIIRVQTTPWNF